MHHLNEPPGCLGIEHVDTGHSRIPGIRLTAGLGLMGIIIPAHNEQSHGLVSLVGKLPARLQFQCLVRAPGRKDSCSYISLGNGNGYRFPN